MAEILNEVFTSLSGIHTGPYESSNYGRIRHAGTKEIVKPIKDPKTGIIGYQLDDGSSVEGFAILQDLFSGTSRGFNPLTNTGLEMFEASKGLGLVRVKPSEEGKGYDAFTFITKREGYLKVVFRTGTGVADVKVLLFTNVTVGGGP